MYREGPVWVLVNWERFDTHVPTPSIVVILVKNVQTELMLEILFQESSQSCSYVFS